MRRNLKRVWSRQKLSASILGHPVRSRFWAQRTGTDTRLGTGTGTVIRTRSKPHAKSRLVQKVQNISREIFLVFWYTLA